MNFFYKLPVDNLKEIQMSALRKITFEDINKIHTRLFYPKYDFLDDLNFVSVLNKYGLYDHVYDIALFIMGSKHTSPIHIDGDGIYKWSFNIPLDGCFNTTTNFFVSEYAPIRSKSPNSNIHYSTYAADQCQLADSLELTEPYIMDVSKPHSIVNPNLTQRISLCVRIKSDFDISNLVDILNRSKNESV
jgi:hypothetical protein